MKIGIYQNFSHRTNAKKKKYLTANAGAAGVAILLRQDPISFAVIVIGTQELSKSKRDILIIFRRHTKSNLKKDSASLKSK